MQIHVARPPNQLGVFSQEEVAAGLQLLPTDGGHDGFYYALLKKG